MISNFHVGKGSSNLADVTWAHAVNDEKYLLEVLNGNINFIEADIQLGYLESDKDQQHELPIMAHPPKKQSDLSLEVFLTKILNFNQQNETDRVKGVKLDFKSIEALEKSIDIITKCYEINRFPVWINADILPGPVNNTSTIPVDANRFFESVKRLEPTVLSIGWTTKWSKESVDGKYSESNIQQMIDTVRENGIDKTGNDITFPIRAGIAAHSSVELSQLYDALKSTNEITFTIWSSADDAVDVESLRQFIFSFGLDKIYIDVPDELKEKLKLHDAL